MPLQLDGKYLLRRVLGVGGMGRTYLAQDKRFSGTNNENCVLKEINGDQMHDANARQLLKREAGRLLSLRHPGIPAYRDFLEQQIGEHTYWYLVQQLIEGESLREQGETKGPTPVQTCLLQMLEVLVILDYLHTLKDPQTGQLTPLIHLDLKPDNIMQRKGDGRIFLIDFGVAAQVHLTQIATHGAKASVSGYTPGFAPFEQTMGFAAPASDLYAWAMTFLVQVTGQHPAKLFDPLRESFGYDTYVTLSADLSALLEACLSVQVKKRPQTAREVIRQLRRVDEFHQMPQAMRADLHWMWEQLGTHPTEERQGSIPSGELALAQAQPSQAGQTIAYAEAWQPNTPRLPTGVPPKPETEPEPEPSLGSQAPPITLGRDAQASSTRGWLAWFATAALMGTLFTAVAVWLKPSPKEQPGVIPPKQTRLTTQKEKKEPQRVRPLKRKPPQTPKPKPTHPLQGTQPKRQRKRKLRNKHKKRFPKRPPTRHKKRLRRTRITSKQSQKRKQLLQRLALLSGHRSYKAEAKVIRELGKLGPAAASAVPAIIQRLEARFLNWSLFREGCVALGRIATPKAIQWLREEIGRPSRQKWKKAVEGLYYAGRQGRVAIPALKRLLQEVGKRDRLIVWKTLAKLDPASKAKMKRTAKLYMAESSASLKQYGFAMLLMLDPLPASSLKQLKQGASSQDASLRYAIAKAMKYARPSHPEIRKLLFQLLHDPKYTVRRAIMISLYNRRLVGPMYVTQVLKQLQVDTSTSFPSYASGYLSKTCKMRKHLTPKNHQLLQRIYNERTRALRGHRFSLKAVLKKCTPK